MSKAPITTQGFERLEAEIKRIKTVDRPDIADRIATARDHGDLKENAEYHAAREQQSFLEGRLAQLDDYVARAEVIDISTLSGDRVMFGATVTVYDVDTEDENTYQIVGEYEADLDKGLISLTSPIAKGLIGKEVDDEVSIRTPGGQKAFEIVSVEYK